jgi:hypothetical protein
LNWVTAVAADCSSLQRSSNLACKSSSRSARFSTSSCRWEASTPCSPASFTKSPATWRTDCSGFFSPPVSSRNAYILKAHKIIHILDKSTNFVFISMNTSKVWCTMNEALENEKSMC